MGAILRLINVHRCKKYFTLIGWSVKFISLFGQIIFPIFLSIEKKGLILPFVLNDNIVQIAKYLANGVAIQTSPRYVFKINGKLFVNGNI